MLNLLTTAPLVNKTWQALTLTPALQHALFFQLDPSFRAERIHNPLLAKSFPPFFARETNAEAKWQDATSIKSMPWSQAPDAFRRPEASWGRMLLTQPPQPKTRTEFHDPPLRMGALFDIALRPLIRFTVATFCVRLDQDASESDDHHPTLAVSYQLKQARPAVLDMLLYYNSNEEFKHMTGLLKLGEWVRRKVS
ncbi:hypothetical protein K438DRAFT_1926816 [Mycena galopus ATCC 62051]|nr:hypothetical protein K438DRAFT_1926816 [Mycena galopus ATCC 62051]